MDNEKIIRRGLFRKKNNKLAVKYPVYFFAGIDRESKCFTPFAFTFSRFVTGKFLSKSINLIIDNMNDIIQKNKSLKKSLGMDNRSKEIIKPLIMIDDGTREKRMCLLSKLDYLICKFHLIKCFKTKCNKIFCNNSKDDEKTKEKNQKLRERLFKKLYIMMASIDSDSFLKSYDKFSIFIKNQKNENLNKFKDYFDKNFKEIYSHWNLEKRDFNIGLFATNNLMELFIKLVTKNLPANRKYLTKCDEIFLFLIENLVPLNNSDFYDTDVGLEIKGSMKKRISLMENSIQIDEIDEFTDKIYTNKKTYTIIKNVPVCNCDFFIFHQRPCKHIFSLFLYLIDKNNLDLPIKTLSDPVEFILFMKNYFINGQSETEKNLIKLSNKKNKEKNKDKEKKEKEKKKKNK